MRGPVVMSLVLAGVFVGLTLLSVNLTAPRLIDTHEGLMCFLALGGTSVMTLFLVHTMHALARAHTMVKRLRLSTRLQVVLGGFGSVCVVLQEGFGSRWSIFAASAMVLMALSAVVGRAIYRRTRGRQHRARVSWNPRALATGFYGWAKSVHWAGQVRRRMIQEGSPLKRRAQLLRFPRHGLDARIFTLWRALHLITLILVIMTAIGHAYSLQAASMT